MVEKIMSTMGKTLHQKLPITSTEKKEKSFSWEGIPMINPLREKEVLQRNQSHQKNQWEREVFKMKDLPSANLVLSWIKKWNRWQWSKDSKVKSQVREAAVEVEVTRKLLSKLLPPLHLVREVLQLTLIDSWNQLLFKITVIVRWWPITKR